MYNMYTLLLYVILYTYTDIMYATANNIHLYNRRIYMQIYTFGSIANMQKT